MVSINYEEKAEQAKTMKEKGRKEDLFDGGRNSGVNCRDIVLATTGGSGVMMLYKNDHGELML